MQREIIYLTRRNLLTLLSKLDRVAAGERSACTIIKCDNAHPAYPQSMPEIIVTAVEDTAYYTERAPGTVLDKDNPNK